MVDRFASADGVEDEKFPAHLVAFVDSAAWVFAVTYAKTWPHHYIVKDRVDETLFIELVCHIRRYGYEGRFYNTPITYFDYDDNVYWTMVPPVRHQEWHPPEEETIINRCPADAPYESRLRAGTLSGEDDA